MVAHSQECFGCGSDNSMGLQMQVWRDGAEVFTDVTFADRHVGAPGITHGGVVSAACDDLFGFVVYLAGVPAVTRNLSIDYQLPVALGEPHRITARLERREGRKLQMSADGIRRDGQVAFTARALFLVVDLAHFERFGLTAMHPGLNALGDITTLG
jgi:acyl-coenzyme A thioesterase PaaI-like protein